MKKEYNKLVRDLIPEIIRRNGGVPTLRELAPEEFRAELMKKLREEVEEFAQAATPETKIEEMADIFEVITAINEVEEWSIEQIVAIQKEKREKRGAFTKRIYLESVEEKE